MKQLLLLICLLAPFSIFPQDQTELILEKSFSSGSMGEFTRISFKNDQGPILTPQGDVVFGAKLNPVTQPTDIVGYFLRRSTGEITTLFRQDSVLPGTQIQGFTKIISMRPGLNGEVFFEIEYQTPLRASSRGLWCLTNSQVSAVIWMDAQFPNYPNDARFYAFDKFQSIRGENCGIIARVYAQMSTAPSGGGSGFESSFVHVTPSSAQNILKLGGPALSIPGKNFDDSNAKWAANSSGAIIFSTGLINGFTNAPEGEALYLYRNSGWQLIAKQGDAATGWESHQYESFTGVAISDSGNYAFSSKTTDQFANFSDELGWLERGGALIPIYLPAESAAEAGTGFHFHQGVVPEVTIDNNHFVLHGFLPNGDLIFGAPVHTNAQDPQTGPGIQSLWSYAAQGRQNLLVSGQSIDDLNSAAAILRLSGNDLVKIGPGNFVQATARISSSDQYLADASAVISNAGGSFKAVIYAGQVLRNPPGLWVSRLHPRSSSNYPPNTTEFYANESGQMLINAVLLDPLLNIFKGTQFYYEPQRNLLRPLLQMGDMISMNNSLYQIVGANVRDETCPSAPGKFALQGICALNGTQNEMASLFESIFTLKPNLPVNLCRADLDNSGTVSLQDLFDFLTYWFVLNPRADIDSNGSVSLQDLFDYLNAYFQGCPGLAQQSRQKAIIRFQMDQQQKRKQK